MCTSPPDIAGLAELFRRLFDHHDAAVCMIGLDGRILAVNAAWRHYGEINGMPTGYCCLGKNYLTMCERGAASGDASAQQALVGLLDVIHTGRQKFVMTYPCHTPDRREWFQMWVEPQLPYAPVIVIAHEFERSEDPGRLPHLHSTCIARG